MPFDLIPDNIGNYYLAASLAECTRIKKIHGEKQMRVHPLPETKRICELKIGDRIKIFSVVWEVSKITEDKVFFGRKYCQKGREYVTNEKFLGRNSFQLVEVVK